MALIRDALSVLTYGLVNKSPVKYSADSNGFGQGGGYGYSQSNALDMGNSIGTLFAIIDLLSTSVAGTDWHLYRKRSDGRRVYGPTETERTEVTKHAAIDLLANPNPFMTGYELFQRSEQYIDLLGESFWIVEKMGALPLALWPVRPDRMEPTVEGGVLAGWEYRQPDGQRTKFKLDEVIFIKNPDPRDLLRGTSPVRSMTTDLEAVQLAGLYNRNFFLNSARPGGIIQVQQTLSDTAFNRLRMQWREEHRGASNAHRVGILENDAKWIETSVSQKDMEFVELRNLSRDLIREGYRVHKHMLGQSDDVNRASALAASADFGQWLLKPRLDRFEQALNHTLLPMFGGTGENVEFCYDDPTPEFADEINADRDSKVAAVVALVNAGADPAETLEAFGLPPLTFKEPEPVPAQLEPIPTPTPAELARIVNMAVKR